jgi:hypothetical protein
MAQAQHVKVRKANKLSPCDQPGGLMLRAKELLKREVERDGDALWIIAARVGVPYHWLVALQRDAIKQPSVNRIQHLVEQLSGKAVRF